MSAILDRLRLPPADAPVAAWHVSPAVDAIAYHWSWALFFVPLWFAGPRHWADYVVVYMLGSTLSFAHRHLTMPYVYGDGDVFSRHPARFVAFPVFLVTGFLLTPKMVAWTVPAGFFTLGDLATALLAVGLFAFALREDRAGHRWSWPAIAASSGLVAALGAAFATGVFGPDHALPTAIAAAAIGGVGVGLVRERGGRGLSAVAATSAALIAVALDAPIGPADRFAFQYVFQGIAAFMALWNIWHVYKQKYGILRVYAAKSSVPPERRASPWADWALVFGWVPLYFVWFARHAQAALQRHAKSVEAIVGPLQRALDVAYPVLLPIAVVIALATIAAWARAEWAASRGESTPRWSMAIATTALAVAILADPVKGYMAFGFAHAVEYVVFVWAYQRRRYAHPLAHDPWIGRALRHPWLAYGAFFLLVGGASYALEFGSYLRWFDGSFRPLGTKPGYWLFYWTVWHSMAHFWYDGFLWQMRLSTVRASL